MATKMSLYVASACNLTCRECIMQHAMAINPKYQMGMGELYELVFAGEQSGYAFDFVLTGGEPLMWRQMADGLKILRSSTITKTITMFSNGMFPDRLTSEIVANLDKIRLSEYFYNKEHVQKLKETYPSKVEIVERTGFWQNPDAPLAANIALPVDCMNPEVMLYDHQVYACPHNLSLAAARGLQDRIKLSVPITPGFLEHLRPIKKNAEHSQEICAACVSNAKVRKHVQKAVNVSKGRTDLAVYGVQDAGTYATEHGLVPSRE